MNKVSLPKDALSKIDLGQSFAEYDLIKEHPYLFVKTPAINVALDFSHTKLFFVGRRGTGKTAITYFLKNELVNTLQFTPRIFDLIHLPFETSKFVDTRQKPFKSLEVSFQRAIYDEVISTLVGRGKFTFEQQPGLSKERNNIEDYDFDLRLLKFIEEMCDALDGKGDKYWLRQVNRQFDIEYLFEKPHKGIPENFVFLIDRIDESWSGTDEAVILLMALMHACVKIRAKNLSIKPYLFIRENIFERVRQLDNEFARLETAVVSLDWNREQLIEMIERRLNRPFYSKLPLGGETWKHFFEENSEISSVDLIFESCQNRPRDILTYCNFAIESAQARKHSIIRIEDVQEAKRRFSDSRLKDLGDEYAENYPQIKLVLNKFYGLGNQFTLSGVDAFIKKLLVDSEVKQNCSGWIYRHTTPALFVELLFNIGFMGIEFKSEIIYRTLGPKTSTPPPIDSNTKFIIHPSYVTALNLREVVIVELDEKISLQKAGILVDIPDNTTLEGYIATLKKIKENLETLPSGTMHSTDFEDLVTEIVKLCFFRCLTNVDHKVRNVDGRVVRDIIAANRANNGFWEMIRQRYGATNIIWECKNYAELTAEDFQQAAYYMTKEIGRFNIIAFRGTEKKKHYYQHIKRISGEKEGGIVLLINEKDLNVFLRQAINGKVKEDHIYEEYERTVREIS